MTWNTVRERVSLSFNGIALAGALQHDSSRNVLALVLDGGGSEVLSIDLRSSGYVAFLGEVFVRDYSEHSGLPAALVAAGVCEEMEEIVLRPFGSRVQRMRVIEHLGKAHAERMFTMPVAASLPVKEFNGLGVDHYVEEVLSIELDFPGSAEFLFGATGTEEIIAAARQDFEDAECAENLAYPHVMQIEQTR